VSQQDCMVIYPHDCWAFTSHCIPRNHQNITFLRVNPHEILSSYPQMVYILPIQKNPFSQLHPQWFV
jgi:hypothetical protein